MEQEREQWGSKMGFIIAAVGSAVGLGNIWRFPYLVYSNGGGAFLIPYFFAIFTAGIPLLILEYGVGHKFRGSTPLSIAQGNKKWEWLGWWPSINAFIILCYYSMILSWAINYFRFSFFKSWGSDPNGLFYNNFLNLSSSPFQLGGIVFVLLFGIALLWAVNWFICFRGIKSGIEKVNKVLLPVLISIMIFIVIKSVNLEGASLGLNTLFTPDSSMVLKPKVWVAAYGQVFFSLSIAMGIMMTYSSYLPKKTDINNSAFMTAFANCGFEFLCSIGVFSILGYMATIQNVSVGEVATSGIGLAFIVFPQIFSTMGVLGNVIGALFFLCLIFAGITSSVSLTEAAAAAIIDKFGFERKKVITIICIVGFLLSSIFATGAGLYFLDIIDNFINNYGIVVVGLLEAIFIGYIIKPKTIRKHTNSMSYFKIGKWWDLAIKYITPGMLLFMLIQSFLTELKSPYEGYSVWALILYGWGVVGFGILVSILISKKPWKKNKLSTELLDA